MARSAAPILALALAAALAGLAPDAARGDAFLALENGQEIEATLPPGEDIRIEFVLAKGSKPNFKLALRGAAKHRPVSFQSTKVYGPDGLLIAVPLKHFYQRHSTGLDVFGFKGWPAPVTSPFDPNDRFGRQAKPYVLVIKTNATITTEVKGRFTVARAKSIPIRGDETALDVDVELIPGDLSSVLVTRVNGTAPFVARYKSPTLFDFSPPSQHESKKGSVTNDIFPGEPGTHRYTIGYQLPGDPAGKWKGKVRIVPTSTSGTVFFFLIVNPPGIPLTVRPADRFLAVDYGSAGCGVGWAGNLLVASEVPGGKIVGKAYNLDLDPVDTPAVELATVVDLPPGQTVSGFRVASRGTFHYVGFSSQSGTSLGLVKLTPGLVRSSFRAIVDGATDTTQDFFLALDDNTISVGRWRAPDGHTVHLVDIATMIPYDAVQIGGGFLTHGRGAGAAWRKETNLFEFYAPDTPLFGQPSDIHHQVYTSAWVAAIGADDKPIADSMLTEYYSTAAVVDEISDALVLHYVVPTNISSGAGQLHRRVFDQNGAEVAGSHVVLPGADRHRPSAAIVDNFLFVGSDSSNGPIVERYKLLR